MRLFFFSITTLAAELDISEATIVQVFHRTLVIKVFLSLKKDLVHYYQKLPYTRGASEKFHTDSCGGGNFSFEKVMRNELKMIEENY